MVKGNRAGFRAQTFKIRPDLVERLDRYSATTGVTKTFAVERAIEAYLAEKMPEYDKKS